LALRPVRRLSLQSGLFIWDFFEEEEGMKRDHLNKLLETLEDIGYEFISIDSKYREFTLRAGIPMLINKDGKPVDPKTGELIPLNLL
jgi:hypothetical protein